MLKQKITALLFPQTGYQKDNWLRGQAPVAMVAVLLLLTCLCFFFGYYISASPSKMPLMVMVGVAVFLIGFFRMDVALVILIVAMLFSPQVSAGAVPRRAIAIRIEDILLVVMGMAWIARAAVYKGMEIIPKTSVNGILGFYCGAFMISTAGGIVTTDMQPLKAMFYVLKYLEYFILFYIAAGSVRNKKNIYIFTAALILTFFCVNIYAASQVGSVGRVSAPFETENGEPNTLGGYQVLMLCVTLGLFCHAPSRLLMVGLAIVALSTIWPFLHTLSRASYMALVPAYLMLLFYNRSPRKNVLIFVLLLGIVGALFFMPKRVTDRLAYTFRPQYQANVEAVEFFGIKFDPSSSARWRDWESAIHYWKKAPFFGYGLTGVSFLDGQYVNNLVELGAVGFIAFALLIWGVQREALRVYRGAQDWVIRGIALGFAAGNIGMIVHAFTANTFILIRVMEPYWFLAAMILVAYRIEEKPVVTVSKSLGRRNIDMILGQDFGKRTVDGT